MTNIVLIGMMGAGKTTIGLLLAEKTCGRFVDTDALIEEKEGMKISEIFKTKGEDYFREIESAAISELSGCNLIISTGGGIVKNTKNLETLKRIGKVFYLEAGANKLYNRIKNNNDRPLLNTENPKKALEDILNSRVEKYKLADFTINTENKTTEQVIQEITEAL